MPVIGLSLMLCVPAVFAAMLALEGQDEGTPFDAAVLYVALVLAAASVVTGIAGGAFQ